MKKESEYLNEMEYIKDWCIAVIDFKLSMNETHSEVKKLYEPLKKGLLENFNSKNKNIQKGFKETYRNLKEEIGYWSETMKADLNIILISKFGETVNQINNANEKEIKNIILRGKINNDDEFRMIDEKVNNICQTMSNSDELDKLNHLLLKYEHDQK